MQVELICAFFGDTSFSVLGKVSMAEDSRKGTLEALERRIAFAKVEVLQKEKKNKKAVNEDGKPPIPADSTSNDRSPHLLHSSSITPKKGNFSFSSHTTLQDIEDGPAYAQFSVTVNENLLTTNEKFSAERGRSIDGILHELLQKGDAAQKYMQGSRNMKIDNWILLDNYVHGRVLSSGSQTRALQLHSKRSKKHMSMKRHKKYGSLELPQEFQKFDIFKPMHEMWKDYIMLLLKSTGKNQLAQCLLGADPHGAFILERFPDLNPPLPLKSPLACITFFMCKRTHFTGICGIMIRETAEAFGIVTEDDKFRVVPKKFSVFVFLVDCWKVTLHGDKLSSRKVGL
ncbi:Ribonuclease P protein subunit p29 [Glycine soja]